MIVDHYQKEREGVCDDLYQQFLHCCKLCVYVCVCVCVCVFVL